MMATTVLVTHMKIVYITAPGLNVMQSQQNSQRIL